MYREKKRYNIHNAKIVYSDIQRNERSLYSHTLQLAGKPDYLIKTKNGHILPVEVKTGWHEEPLKHHVMQLIAYCQLVEETKGTHVPYGVLVYYDTDVRFRIPFNTYYKHELKESIHHMREALRTGDVKINHEDPTRCKHCSVRRYCHEALS